MSDIELLKTKTLGFALVAGLALGACANMGSSGGADESMPQSANEQSTLSEADQNRDDRISEDEFRRHAQGSGLLREWDADGDGALQEGEFADIGLDRSVGSYNAWDEDGDGEIGGDEFFSSVFNAFDEDNDGYWSSSESNDAGGSGIFDI